MEGTNTNTSIKKLPYLYLGIDLEIDEKIELLKSLKTAIENLCIKYNNYLNSEEEKLKELIDIYSDKKDISDINTVYKISKSFHVTTCFMGRKFKNYKNQAIQSFKENKLTEIKVHGFVIIPNIIIGCIITTDEYVENEYPHITIFTSNDVKAKNTNDLMKCVFDQNIHFVKLRLSGFAICILHLKRHHQR